MLLPAQALADPFVENWFARCVAEADAQALIAPVPDAVPDVNYIQTSSCAFRLVEICRFASEPLACLKVSQDLTEGEIERRALNLPETVEGGTFTAKRYAENLQNIRGGLTELERMEASENLSSVQIETMIDRYLETIVANRPNWMPSMIYVGLWETLVQFNTITFMESSVRWSERNQ